MGREPRGCDAFGVVCVNRALGNVRVCSGSVDDVPWFVNDADYRLMLFVMLMPSVAGCVMVSVVPWFAIMCNVLDLGIVLFSFMDWLLSWMCSR